MMSTIRGRSAQRGYSLMEIMVVLAITTIVMLAAYDMVDNASSSSMFMESRNDLPIMGQGAVNVLQSDILQAAQIYQADTVGLAYWKQLDFSKVGTPWAPTTTEPALPVFDSAAVTFDVDPTSTRYVGNAMMLVRQLDPIQVDTGLTDPPKLLVNRYRFDVFYLTKDTTRNFGGQGYILDFYEAKSDVYADYNQLSGLSAIAAFAGKLTTIQTNIYNAGLTVAFAPDQPVASGFYTVGKDGTLKASTPYSIKLLAASSGSLLKGIGGGRISGKMAYSVGFRKSDGTAFPVRDVVPKYATFSTSDPTFPSGVEFLVVGPSGSRKVLCRLVLMSQYGANKWDSRESTVIAAAQ